MSIYKECDIRGVFEKEFDETVGYYIGRAVGTLHKNATIVVAGDVRLSTPVLKEQLISGLKQSGSNVIDLGIITTPMFYYALYKLGVQGGIMVTASHNPPQYNGFKLMFGKNPITAGEIKDIEKLVDSKDFIDGTGTYTQQNIAADYQEFISSFFEKRHQKRLKIVLDCCDGTTSEFVPEIVANLGYEVVRLYCDVDGNFPNRNPDPALYTCLADLGAKVIETGADLGAGYDGDGDRVVFVDNKGQVIKSEKSFVIFIKDCLKHYQEGVRYKDLLGNELQPSFVYDQKSMMIVKETIEENGGMALIQKSGYGFIKQNFLEEHSMMGGEISGHFFFGEIGGDDGLFATLRMCQILENTNQTLAEIVEVIPPSYISPELRISCPYDKQDNLLSEARALAREYQISEMDGVRIIFPCGWFLIRKSITSQAVTVRMEADSPENLQWMRMKIKQAIPELAEHNYFQNML